MQHHAVDVKVELRKNFLIERVEKMLETEDEGGDSERDQARKNLGCGP